MLRFENLIWAEHAGGSILSNFSRHLQRHIAAVICRADSVVPCNSSLRLVCDRSTYRSDVKTRAASGRRLSMAIFGATLEQPKKSLKLISATEVMT
jgi:hypothetical protein